MLNGVLIVRLPDDASHHLSSRGQVAAECDMNGHTFQTVIEPDGERGHWIRIDGALQQVANIHENESVTIHVEQQKEWPEPTIPDDLLEALSATSRDVHDVWLDITPMARWEWVRWVDATNNLDTRKRRIEVTISKIQNGKRRPCCFNLSACTDPRVSKNGKLIEQ